MGICRHADKVVVMKAGKVVECGGHEELVRARMRSSSSLRVKSLIQMFSRREK